MRARAGDRVLQAHGPPELDGEPEVAVRLGVSELLLLRLRDIHRVVLLDLEAVEVVETLDVNNGVGGEYAFDPIPRAIEKAQVARVGEVG